MGRKRIWTGLSLLVGIAFFMVGSTLNRRDEHGRSLLHTTTSKALAHLMLAMRTDPNTRDSHGQAPLHSNNNARIAELLLSRGAEINAKNNDGNTPLHLAVAFGWQEKVKLLIDNGADKLSSNKWGKTPVDFLQWRAEKLGAAVGDTTKLKKLLSVKC